MKKILVVCGAGVATSTVAAQKLQSELQRRGIAAKIAQCKVTEVAAQAPGHDLIVTTTILGQTTEVPVVQTLSFLTGVGIEADIDRIVALLEG